METGIREYLKRLLTTISLIILWMMVQLTFGLWLGWAYATEQWAIGNIAYYLFAVISLAWVIWFLYKLWTKPVHIEE